MRKKTTSIPINSLADEFSLGIAIGKASIEDLHAFKEVKQSHRDNYHIFFLQEEGTTSFEVDFQEYKIKPSSVGYVHPHQVHRMIAFENVTLSVLMINSEKLYPEYRKLLEDITPAKPLKLNEDAYSIIAEAISLCMKVWERKHEKLYESFLSNCCNALVGLITSQYLKHTEPIDTLSRFEIINKAFKALLECNFTTSKRPSEYAKALNISTPYLNECVKSTTGFSVSHHIQQRVILEAKRLLYYSDKSVKEIASELGFDDYPYFSRLFTKVAKMSALTFRNKNLD